MPDLPVPVIDSHVHLWNPDRFRLRWLDNIARLNRPYLLEDYFEHTGAVPIEGFVYIETDIDRVYAFLEAQWAAGLAAHEPRMKGIVAHAPLEHGERARAYLEGLAALGPIIKGVRRLIQDEPDPDFCLQPAFVQGVQMLPGFGFSFDLCIRHYQLPAAVELVKRCPETGFILDHIAKPAIKQGELEPWRAGMRELAALPNVACKLSGLVTEADHQNWQEADLQPYVAHVLEVFGEDRVLFGSDWPVALQASEYPRWVETLAQLTGHLSPAAKRKLWAGNARRYYRLGE
jgi:L-fuconolactonase